MFRVRKLNTTQPPNHPPTANFESMTWEEFVKVAKSKSRKIKQNFHTYLRFNDEYFYPVLFKIIMLVSFLIFPYDLSIILSRHLKKVKMSSKLITQGFYHFQFHSIWKKLLWILYKMLRYLVRILHPQIFSLSSVAGHFW